MDNDPHRANAIFGEHVEGAYVRNHEIEAAGIAEALADVAAGRLIDEADADAWLDSLGTDHELPMPQPPR